jgi:tRNA pseudouridine38-40 synthase
MRVRYKIIIEYLGTKFVGWQRQKNGLSVQEVIESAIYALTKENIRIFGSGRTDAGVHATGQVAHFDLSKLYEPSKLVYSLNHFLKGYDVGILSAEIVDQEFHARFSAIKRYYTYKIVNRPSQIVIQSGLAWWIREKLDINSMRIAKSFLEGKHDFSAFRGAHCQAVSPVRTMDKIEILEHGNNEIHLHFIAQSFLHHMVRNIVGSLVMVGMKKWEQPDYIQKVLQSKSRTVAGPMAPASGLYFTKIDYKIIS